MQAEMMNKSIFKKHRVDAIVFIMSLVAGLFGRVTIQLGKKPGVRITKMIICTKSK